jgi:hypothetical protein
VRSYLPLSRVESFVRLKFRKEHSIYRPSSTSSILKRRQWNAYQGCNLRNRSTFPVELVGHRVALVSGLSFLCGPPAVARFVVRIVVDTVDRGANRSSAHVMQERGEVIHPSFAHLDAATSVIGPQWVRRDSASPSHADPSCPRWGLRPPVARDRSGNVSSFGTATTTHFSASQLRCRRLVTCAAVACALPAGVPRNARRNLMLNDKKTKPLSSQIN